jgi:hypothetical protein
MVLMNQENQRMIFFTKLSIWSHYNLLTHAYVPQFTCFGLHILIFIPQNIPFYLSLAWIHLTLFVETA